MTEEEAKTKWCHATAFRSMADALDREPENAGHRLNGSRCIASACMAWRETDPSDTLRAGGFRQGFCGLAGAPQ